MTQSTLKYKKQEKKITNPMNNNTVKTAAEYKRRTCINICKATNKKIRVKEDLDDQLYMQTTQDFEREAFHYWEERERPF